MRSRSRDRGDRRGYGSPRRDRSGPRGGYDRSPPRGGGYDRSPPRGGGGRGPPPEKISLLVRNIGERAAAEDLRRLFERYGVVKDVYIPTDYYTQRPKPFAFIEFIDYEEARHAKEDLDRRDFQGRQIDVVFAQQRRKTPDQMRTRDVGSGRPRSRSPYRSRSPRRSRSPPRRRDERGDRDDGRSRDGTPPPRRDGTPPPRRDRDE